MSQGWGNHHFGAPEIYPGAGSVVDGHTIIREDDDMVIREHNEAGSVDGEGADDRKLASRVAGRIMREVVKSGWPIGAVIGSEFELLERYEVSRAVFREAVRLLEHLGVARTRRGPGGGLIVSEPSTAAVVQAVMVHLTYARLSLGDLMEARISLERTIAKLAAENADEAQVVALRNRIRVDRERQRLDAHDHHVLHTMIGRAANNPAAELFVDVLGRLTARWAYPELDDTGRMSALDLSARAHTVIVDAITAGDPAMAERRMNVHLAGLADWLGRHRQSPVSLEGVLDDSADLKLGSQVARRIIVDIVEREWPVGEILGSESQLIERYGVSRAALREAVRLLEYLRVATMRRGPGGGLIVTTPNVDPIVEAATVFLEFRKIQSSDLITLLVGLESDAVALVVERATDADIEQLRSVIDSSARREFEEPIDEDLHVRIAGLSGNAAVALFVRVLVQLIRAHAAVPGRGSPRRTVINAETSRAQHAIVDAIAGRDAALARRRIVKHLEAIQPLLR